MAPSRSRKPRSRASRDIQVVHDFALSLERGRFTEYIETLSNPRRLLWRNFLAGLGRGFGAVVGATIVVALMVGLLAWIGDSLPGELGDFFTNTSQKIQPTPV